MRILNPKDLAVICGTKQNDNMESACVGVDMYGRTLGFERVHRLAQYVPQLAHESGRFRHDREVWGPTAAQKRYDTRTDLGNTAAVDGDGFRLRGRTPIQITGGDNYRAFTAWAKAMFPHLNPPDFFENPDAANTDPWEGLGPLWYWERTSLNRYADEGDIEMVTRRINGGLNGYADRLQLYDRTALHFLGFHTGDVSGFQRATPGLTVDGVSGPRTRAAMHKALVALPPIPVADDPIPPVKVLTADELLANIAASINAYLESKDT